MARLLDTLARWLPALRTRRFDAAAGGRRWHGVQTFGAINAEIAAAARPVARRASYYCRNNPWVANGVASIVSGAIGAGIKPQSQHPDRAVREALHAAWQRWTDEADADGVTDAYGLQALAVRATVESGECSPTSSHAGRAARAAAGRRHGPARREPRAG